MHFVIVFRKNIEYFITFQRHAHFSVAIEPVQRETRETRQATKYWIAGTALSGIFCGLAASLANSVGSRPRIFYQFHLNPLYLPIYRVIRALQFYLRPASERTQTSRRSPEICMRTWTLRRNSKAAHVLSNAHEHDFSELSTRV